ncbi:hypothetical protein GCM10023194_74930 [Planotetraspora phitsanulokensis]|uniref:Sec-independent protein translocase protein TatA n=1 Tax=Planotetraspora phitsanulokensis TaxID=575192 RepID=A0A8J3XN71_9ACTN|nr:Sec-independent protein translocase subunit TatA [Planotetraspora phitsanulokensis]GII42498.1 hypothetical protein Pph01_75010 [Planotetraspora phitsanulokensis]
MGELSVWHWLIVALVFVMLFGAKRLPDTARSLGQALRVFKQETSRMRDDHDTEDPAETRQTPSTPLDAPSLDAPSLDTASPVTASLDAAGPDAAHQDPRLGYGASDPSSSAERATRPRPGDAG